MNRIDGRFSHYRAMADAMARVPAGADSRSLQGRFDHDRHSSPAASRGSLDPVAMQKSSIGEEW